MPNPSNRPSNETGRREMLVNFAQALNEKNRLRNEMRSIEEEIRTDEERIGKLQEQLFHCRTTVEENEHRIVEVVEVLQGRSQDFLTRSLEEEYRRGENKIAKLQKQLRSVQYTLIMRAAISSIILFCMTLAILRKYDVI